MNLLNVLVGLVDVIDGDDGQVAVITEIAESNPGSGLDTDAVYRLLREIEGDGHGEEGTIGETVIRDDTGTKSAFCAKKFQLNSTHPL